MFMMLSAAWLKQQCRPLYATLVRNIIINIHLIIMINTVNLLMFYLYI